MRIVFMGSPAFAVPTLERLIKDGHQVCGVFTRQDKPRGRGMKTEFTPVKEYALKAGIPVYQPAGFKDGAALETLRALAPECIVVVAYGRILPPDVLELPKYGCINLHASLLPRWRGAAPIQRAVMAGEQKTGVTSMYMAPGLDEGDIIFLRELPIGSLDTAGDVHDALMQMGAEVISETLKAIGAGTAPRLKQDDRLSCYAAKIEKADVRIDWTQSVRHVCDLIRGADPFPGAWTELEGGIFKIYGATPEKDAPKGAPGQILFASPGEGLICACGDGAVRIGKLCAPGGRRMPAEDYLRGHVMPVGSVFKGA